ncbi:MAG TPA: NAD-dependent epimerase/dehydratase family protein, partial [Chthoniobacterales bacterium]|nr:NAD-dependent epimerase/dehydratase family protein [Chthoniobacterales bacterium]
MSVPTEIHPAPKVALLGAAGAIGQSLAAALQLEKDPYQVVGRSQTSLQSAFGGAALAEIRTWNLDELQTVRQALDGIETVIYLVGVNYWEFQLHPVLLTKVLDSAISVGVKRFFLIGTVYPYGKPQTNPVSENHPRAPHTFKGQMRKEQEDLLFESDRAGKIQACELRLPDFFGPNVDKSFLWNTFQAAKF